MLSAVYENYMLAFERMKPFEIITRIYGNDIPDAISTAIWQEIEHLL
jgi:hypothetical protein